MLMVGDALMKMMLVQAVVCVVDEDESVTVRLE